MRLSPDAPDFNEMIATRYAGFLTDRAPAVCELDVFVQSPPRPAETHIRVSKQGRVWRVERGNFTAEWDPHSRRGWVNRHPSFYCIDTLLRIVHTLLLAELGGFLLHASSVVRNGRAFLFAGVSGAGKTTIARLAPRDTTLLTDEIYYIRPRLHGYSAHGTPFRSSDSQEGGKNVSAPIETVFLLEKGTENRVEAVESPIAARSLLRNVLFFARDTELVNRVFEAAVEFVSRIPVKRLFFAPDERVWELIQ